MVLFTLFSHLFYGDGFSVQITFVETLDAFVRLHHRCHGNKAEALGAGTLGVRDDLRSNNLRVESYNLNELLVPITRYCTLGLIHRNHQNLAVPKPLTDGFTAFL